MIIPKSSSASRNKNVSLAIFGDLTFESQCQCIFGHSSQGDFYDDIFTICTGLQALGSVDSMASPDMPGIFEMEQGPELFISLKYNVASPAPVTAIRASSRVNPCTQKMGRRHKKSLHSQQSLIQTLQ
jgi:hypothetical protein